MDNNILWSGIIEGGSWKVSLIFFIYFLHGKMASHRIIYIRYTFKNTSSEKQDDEFANKINTLNK